ncbi:hypothetical protein F7725_025754 [Dissostichus mawsoni]|uniref:Uncharacterized protein n=1 Tax=Dissostichus mawsoni TaxID=36200 RepID=A0A7J5X5Y8_DISMA|nr:hypothetical protein F7725_025754 [Dissostichus mawsoni]
MKQEELADPHTDSLLVHSQIQCVAERKEQYDTTTDPPGIYRGLHQQRSEGPGGQSAQQLQTDLDSIFMLLEDHIITFVKSELKKIQTVLSSDYPECLENQREDEEVLDDEDEEQRRSSREAFLNISLHFLRSMKQEELADRTTPQQIHQESTEDRVRGSEEVLDGEDEEQRRSSREAFLNIALHFLRSMKQEELADRTTPQQIHQESTEDLLEDHIITFVKSELKKIQTVLSSDYPECLENQREDEEVLTMRMKSRGGAAERHF